MNIESDCIFLNKVSLSIDNICKALSLSLDEKKLCVCISGGADSTALLVSLDLLKSRYGYKLCAAHVNHLLRKEESDRDERFCADLCKKLKIELYLKRIDVKEKAKRDKKSIEEAARDARYAYFGELSQQKDIDFFTTAHTKNDNAETLYMHIIRGTTTSGLCGIPVINGKILRPMLNISRGENLAFLSQKKQEFVTDSSNYDNAFTRNYIRNVIFPAAEKLNNKYIDSANTLCDYAKTDEDYFGMVIESIPDNLRASELHPAILRRKLQKEYAEFTVGKSLMSVHLNALTQLAASGQGKSINLPGGVVAINNNGIITFEYPEKKTVLHDSGVYELAEGENSFCNGYISIHLLGNNRIQEANIYNNYTYTKLYFNNIVGRVKYRARKPGDRILLNGIHRSIKKEFNAKRIPLGLRAAIPIFFDDEGIIYVPFIGVADRVSASDMRNKDSYIITVRIMERQD